MGALKLSQQGLVEFGRSPAEVTEDMSQQIADCCHVTCTVVCAAGLVPMTQPLV